MLRIWLCWLLSRVTVFAMDSGYGLVKRGGNSSASPIVATPSQYWEGHDGAWSTFSLRVGNPDQYVRTMISTTAPEALVVLSTICADASIDCLNSRGGTFNISKSKTWNDQGSYNLGLFQANLGYTDVVAQFGLERLGLGLSDNFGPTLTSQVIAAFDSSRYGYGMLGLSILPTNFTTFENPQSSFFTSLYDAGLLPSLSWSYTAGARYRNKGVFGSLVFGGYDSSRFTPNSLSFDFAKDVSRDLVVGIQSVVATISNGTQYSLLPNGILAFVDSTLPYLWLPVEACRAFETTFGLEWNSAANTYLVSEKVHNNLLKLNPSVVFKLGNTEGGGPVVSITLPYASFDLVATYPLDAEQTRYFPLKRAANDTQYTLGRVFLQESYLIADYERLNFSISQCTWDSNAEQKIITIPSRGKLIPETTDRNITTGVVAGIIVVIAASLAVIALLVYGFTMRKRFFRRRRESESKYIPELIGSRRLEDQELDSKSMLTPAELEAVKATVNELDSEQFRHHDLSASMPSRPETATVSKVHEMSGNDSQCELQTTRESGLPGIQVWSPVHG